MTNLCDITLPKNLIYHIDLSKDELMEILWSYNFHRRNRKKKCSRLCVPCSIFRTMVDARKKYMIKKQEWEVK